MYPDRDTLSNVPRSGYITTRDQSMVESSVTEGGKNTTLLVKGKDADNIRKVLCKSFIQWF